MKKLTFFSIRYRIMLLSFLLVSLTVCSLIYFTNVQMEQLFWEYVRLQPSGKQPGTGELDFLNSVHHSLIWVGLVFVLLGLAASFLFSRNITIPLRRLSAAAESIRRGSLKQQVPVTTSDEVGQLTSTFNKMSAELAQNERTRREFLANIAHELRTPLAILSGNLENMLEGVTRPDMQRLLSMQEEVMRLSRLVSDLRDLSLAEVHHLELHRAPTDLKALLVRATDMLSPLLEEKHLYFSCNLASDLPLVNIDADRINQVFYNVLTNAIRYTRAGTAIEIAAKNDGAEISITIRDHGYGIAAKDLPRIFDQFYRSDKSRSRASGGSGIGLALARQFVAIHGGSITAANHAGGGTVVTICLPVK